MNDHAVRSLTNLQASASTARVMNLLAVWRRRGEDEDYQSRPLFRNPILNRSLIVKHRLRRDEVDLFSVPRKVATKVILPIDLGDLRLGGQYLFVGQKGFDLLLKDGLGPRLLAQDLEVLQLLDRTPSLDPFLVREQLKRHGFSPARCYFDVSDADMKRMFAFVADEVAALVQMSVGAAAARNPDTIQRMVTKLLSGAVDAELEPLRQTLRLSPAEYREGVFCWKGFLYYKWSLSTITAGLAGVLGEIAALQPNGVEDREALEAVVRSRGVLRRGVLRTHEGVKTALKVYDDAYANLVNAGRPNAFREFLLDAPKMFTALGERLGALQHMVSFWRYRFPAGEPVQIDVEELMDIYADFENSLAPAPAATAAAA